ncbi:hypothetical protein GLOIN_2v1884061 [Rhizophagus irregularis DAOM 181602=DAOM 197198]|nr:hypothetical protein GLOIN_2v1884061 [Rhizophagus irregularis DAOM 181602=DAOM 197198]
MYIILEERRLSIKNDIINVFINDKTRFTHLYIPQNFNYQIHLIPGAEFCFSRLEFLFCKTSVNEKVLDGLTKICKSIKELEIFIENCNNNYEIIKLIENQRNLYNISFTNENTDESFCKILEKSLIKHENNIQYFKMTKPLITNVLSSFVNLKILELVSKFKSRNIKWNCLENISLPCLQILRAYYIPIYVLTNLINNSSGSLIEINIDYISHSQNKMSSLIDKYIAEGIVKKYDYNINYKHTTFKDFEWI